MSSASVYVCDGGLARCERGDLSDSPHHQPKKQNRRRSLRAQRSWRNWRLCALLLLKRNTRGRKSRRALALAVTVQFVHSQQQVAFQGAPGCTTFGCTLFWMYQDWNFVSNPKESTSKWHTRDILPILGPLLFKFADTTIMLLLAGNGLAVGCSERPPSSV